MIVIIKLFPRSGLCSSVFLHLPFLVPLEQRGGETKVAAKLTRRSTAIAYLRWRMCRSVSDVPVPGTAISHLPSPVSNWTTRQLIGTDAPALVPFPLEPLRQFHAPFRAEIKPYHKYSWLRRTLRCGWEIWEKGTSVPIYRKTREIGFRIPADLLGSQNLCLFGCRAKPSLCVGV